MGSLKIALVLLALFFILMSCKLFVKNIVYKHEPSKEFRKNYDSSEAVLQLFIDHEVLFIVGIEGFEKHEIWLGLYSKEKGKSVVIKKATLSNEENEDTYKKMQYLMLRLYLKNILMKKF